MANDSGVPPMPGVIRIIKSDDTASAWAVAPILCGVIAIAFAVVDALSRSYDHAAYIVVCGFGLIASLAIGIPIIIYRVDCIRGIYSNGVLCDGIVSRVYDFGLRAPAISVKYSVADQPYETLQRMGRVKLDEFSVGDTVRLVAKAAEPTKTVLLGKIDPVIPAEAGIQSQTRPGFPLSRE
jgi:hypothetical protein